MGAGDDTKPWVLKLPPDDKAAEHEVEVWKMMSQHGEPPHLAGPLQLINFGAGSTVSFRRGVRSARKAVLMPMYSCTMEAIPELTEQLGLRLGKQLKVSVRC